jgi:hypothetical protein
LNATALLGLTLSSLRQSESHCGIFVSIPSFSISLQILSFFCGDFAAISDFHAIFAAILRRF